MIGRRPLHQLLQPRALGRVVFELVGLLQYKERLLDVLGMIVEHALIMHQRLATIDLQMMGSRQ